MVGKGCLNEFTNCRTFNGITHEPNTKLEREGGGERQRERDRERGREGEIDREGGRKGEGEREREEGGGKEREGRERKRERGYRSTDALYRGILYIIIIIKSTLVIIHNSHSNLSQSIQSKLNSSCHHINDLQYKPVKPVFITSITGLTMCVDRLQQLLYINSSTARNMLGRMSERTSEAEGSLPGGTLSIARNTSHL